MFRSSFRVRTHSFLVTFAMLAALLVAPPAAIAAEPVPGADFTLTILHNNDGESQLVNAGSDLEDFGGVARFKTLVDTLRADAAANDNGVLMLSSGDNFLAGPEFNASIEKGVPFYDAIAIEAIGYDAISLGNHDFDFGPDILAEFLSSYTSAPQYLNSNLDFTGEPGLQAFVDSGVIAASTVVTTGGEDIGIVGAVTPGITAISSPRNVVIDPDVAGAIQAEVDSLTAAGVNKIVVISHLQDIEEDIALAAELTGVDIMIAGGGDELLANPGDPLVPGEEDSVFGAYPLTATGADGAQIPVVTTPGEYKYVGQLSVGFDADGNVTAVGADSGPKVVDSNSASDPDLQANVVDPVVAATASLDATAIGTSEVDLDGTRTSVRAVEANEGNLIADALRWQATELADAFGVPVPDVAIQNGGGIRNNTIIPAGEITLLDTFDMVPFPNFVAVVEDIGREQFKEILENAYSNVPGDGRFAQISGFSVLYDPAKTAQEVMDDGTVVTPGERIIDVTLDDGTALVADGAVVAGDPIAIATIDFLARGGDQYPYRGAPFTAVGVSYQQAVANYITGPLAGLISAADYPEGGEGRIAAVIPTVDGPFTPIYEIQGSGDASPLADEMVEVAGVVTGVFADLGGFYLQDESGDGDPATSDGVFVESDASVVAGDSVELRGTVVEFFDETRIVDVEAAEVEEAGGTIAATAVTLPSDQSLEAVEGMLVTFDDYLFVTDTFNLHRFGEALLAAGGVLVNPTDAVAPGDPANELAAANTARSIVLDDGSGDQFPDAVPYFGDDGTLRRGDAAQGVTANVSFSFGAYKLQPTAPVDFVRMNDRPGGPDDVGGNIKVASFNVLNFFSTIDDGENGARGADSDAEKAAQLEKLVAAVGGLGADIIGLQEIENNGPTAIAELVDALNAAAGAGTWAAAADPVYPGGLETTNAIKVGIIFKPASVTPVGGTEVSEDPVFGADRPPIAHSFSVGGDTFTVIVNHFKSKSSSNAEGADLDQGDGQGAYNARRTEQAKALLEFTDELATSVGDPDVLVIGDFNSYSMEDPITTLETELTNLVKDSVDSADSYSLVFFGAQGLLDGAFATDSMEEKVTGVDIWHINADEPRVLQYNDDVVDPAERESDFNQPVSQPDEFSSSDHDPLVVGLELGEAAAPITLNYGPNNDRSEPSALEGATVSGKTYVFIDPYDPGLGFTTVDFYLDGRAFHTERLAPYDFVSGNFDTASAWDTTKAEDGEHSIRAVGNLPDGTTVETSATFTVDNEPDPMPAEFGLAWSPNRDRSASAVLEGATASGELYIFIDPLFPEGYESFGPVTFYLDGERFHTERLAPYDFVSGGVDRAGESWDSTTVADGEHVVTVKVAPKDGPPLMASATFVVDNEPDAVESVRFATFNASLNRSNEGDLVADLSTPDDEQARVIAEIIQRTRPEVLLLNEFDYDASGEAAKLFQDNYLSVSQNGADPIAYGYEFSAPSNTGVASGLDLDNSGDVGGPGDAYGFGFFPGQFGMQVYSQNPIDSANVRTFQNFLWKDMPGALLPVDPDTGAWYSDEELEAVRLSSKSHWDVPIQVGDVTVSFLVSHPTPPVFDGPEDRNGTRNSDEIRFWADYVNESDYIYDDNGVAGGWSGDYFVIAGDQNSDPLDGDSIPGSAQQLLEDARINATSTPSSPGAVEQNALQGGANETHLSDPAYDTADFSDTAPGNLRADYVLPSANLDIVDSGVFWPETTDPLFSLVGTFPFPSSDHRLVWVDIAPGDTELPPAVPTEPEPPEPSEPIIMEGEIDGAPYRIVMPASPELWNGGLITYAHGYVDALDHPSEGTERDTPVAAPGGAETEQALVELGYAVAGSQYKTDGWAVGDGIVDTEALTKYFIDEIAVPDRSILWGFSMGSIVTAHLAENSTYYDGAIPACFVGAGAPRAFDVGLALPIAYAAAFGWPEAWGTVGDLRDDLDFETEVLPVIGSQLFADPLDPSAGLNPDNLGKWLFVQAASGVPAEDFFTDWLFTDMYFATEARAELERRAGGPAASNDGHVYSVPEADRVALEAMGVDVVGYITEMNDTNVIADPAARQYLVDYYEYNGGITMPVITVHTTIDGLVPVEHESAYEATIGGAGQSDLLVQTYTDTYPEGTSSGHCTFTPDQLGAAISGMEFWLATGTPPGADMFPEEIGFVPGFAPGPWPQPPGA